MPKPHTSVLTASIPDATLTPGEVFDGVTADQVCVPGYSRGVREVT